MAAGFATRMLLEPDKRVLARFAWNFGWKGMRAVQRFEKRMARGEDFFPAFMFISVTDRCNLACQGCWVTTATPPRELDLATLDRLVRECKAQGSFFFGILGGEPLLHKGLFDLFGRHPDAYFLLFTNGTLLTDETAREMRRLGNVSPLISIEGTREVSDERRGGSDVYERTLAGVEHCRRHRLVIGAATSICRSNVEELASERFIRDLARRGVHYLWYYIYRPVGPRPTPELALSAGQITDLRRFIVDSRKWAPLLVVDAYWDHEGRALCPAAVGMAHHIGPGGDVEPCPPLQFAADNIHDGRPLADLFRDSTFLRAFRDFSRTTTRGCVIMDDPERLRAFLLAQAARDTSGRGTGLQELADLRPHPSHGTPEAVIPERNRVFRLAKKYWFFGFGAYG
jgi:MoaA/NifB/PqqE/SkfB family radical SAM enzyme